MGTGCIGRMRRAIRLTLQSDLDQFFVVFFFVCNKVVLGIYFEFNKEHHKAVHR